MVRNVCGSCSALMFLYVAQERLITHSSLCISRSFLPCSEKICMAVTEMAALFPKVTWLPTASCPSPEQLRDLLFVWKQPEGIFNYLFGSVQPCSLHYLLLYLPFIGLLCFMFTLSHTHTHNPLIAASVIYGRCHVAPLSPSLPPFSSQRPSSETVRGSLCLLTSSASRLHGECQKAAEHNPCPSDIQLVTQQVIQCAYDIAKAAKQLVTVTTKENNN